MVFIGGPRQVGKTTIARHILSDVYDTGRYFNWDYDEDRCDVLSKRWSSDERLLVFDGLHKYPHMKDFL